MSTRQTCEYCKWWSLGGPVEGTKGSRHWGICHRYAPRPSMDMFGSDYPIDQQSFWPKTRHTNFCGEFREEHPDQWMPIP